MKKRLSLMAMIFMLIVAACLWSSCSKPPQHNADTNTGKQNGSNNQGPSPNANNNGNGTKIPENDNPTVDVDPAMIFKVDRDVSLKAKGAVEFAPIIYSLFRSGDMLRVGDQSIAWVKCADGTVCPLGKGEYSECCRGACDNGLRLNPPEGTETRAYMMKIELPPNERRQFELTETKIRALGASEITTQFLIADLYSSWKLKEANQEVDKLSIQLKDPKAAREMSTLYLPMVRKSGDMYYKMDKRGQAEESYKKVVELAPQSRAENEKASALVSLGQLYDDSGRKQEAVEKLEQGKKIYEKEGDVKKAADVNRKIIKAQRQ